MGVDKPKPSQMRKLVLVAVGTAVTVAPIAVYVTLAVTRKQAIQENLSAYIHGQMDAEYANNLLAYEPSMN